jgi:hypothetical protein
LTKIALEGYWGEFDGICFADAGCEANPNWFSARTLNNRILFAQKNSVLAYAINTPENEMTKDGVLRMFPYLIDPHPELQFQTGTYYISGHEGLEIIRKWDEICWSEPYNINDELREGDLKPFFVEHRFEQSIFSLLLKREGIDPFFPHPPGVDRNIRPALQNLKEPIWWARNRGGIDMRSRLHKSVTRIYVSSTIFSHKLNHH